MIPPMQFFVCAGTTPADVAADPHLSASINSEGYKPVSIAEAEVALSYAAKGTGRFFDCGEGFYYFTADHPEASRLESLSAIYAPCDPDLVWAALDSDAVAIYCRTLTAT